MAKIVEAINTMIKSRDNITSVRKHAEEYFFMFKDTKWSIEFVPKSGLYKLFYYPDNSTQDELISTARSGQWEHVNLIFFDTNEYSDLEAQQSFAELHKIVKSKLFDIDFILDNIISGG